MLLASALGWAVLQTGRFALPPLLPTIIADLDISLSGAGVVLAALQAGYAIVQYPTGRGSDQLSRATLIVPGFALLGASFLVIGTAPSFAVLVAGTGLLGVGKGFYATPVRALLSDLFVERRGRALGALSAGTDVGGVVAAATAGLLLGVVTWRTPFLAVAAAVAVIGALFAYWNREPYAFAAPDLDPAATGERLAGTRRQREVLLAFCLFYFMVNGFVNFLPAYLVEAKGVSHAMASAGYALLFALGVGVKPVAGGLSDRYSRRTVSTVGLGLGAVALGALLLADGPLAIAGAIVTFAVGYKAQFPVIDALVLDAAPDANTGGDLGAARALFLGAGSLGAAFVGVVADHFGYPVAFLGLDVCLVLSAALLVRDRYR